MRGDIIGIFDPGIFSIGDTLTTAKDKFQFEGIPTFAPEHFCTCTSDRLHEAQAVCKGVTQIAQEGAIQIFQEYKGGMEEIIVGVVGVLQFDVPGSVWKTSIMWRSVWRIFHMNISAGSRTREEVDVDALTGTSDMKKVIDMKGNPLLLFVNAWSVGMTLDRNEGLVLSEFSKN